METNFNFKSAICTDIKQSERLLALGLKKETADMTLHFSCMDGNAYYIPYPIGHQCNGIPAWSLHRLMEMAFNSLNDADADAEDEIYFIRQKSPFESMLELFEWLIKEGYLNKEYLV